MTCDITIGPLAEDTLLLHFGDTIDPATNARVHAAARALREAALPGVTDIAPAYASLLIRFDPQALCDQDDASPCARIAALSRALLDGIDGKNRLPSGTATRSERDSSGTGVETDMGFVEIPVCYGDEFGPDLEAVAAHAGMSSEEVISRHSAVEYTVAMLGFAPGFPYLLGLDPALHVPRRETPRTRVPAGSVAIGGAQTGIYPRELPGGWNLIGRTPLALFDPQYESPALLLPGDRVRFRNIQNDEFERLREKYRHGWPSVDSRNHGRSQK
ncbi:MAG: 5-oxoprolinase subunit PxpB [Rhodanobacteraceae bacterium]